MYYFEIKLVWMFSATRYIKYSTVGLGFNRQPCPSRLQES
uniref:Uncharacterized protein n=2 Tax=Anguilla anguilla TaxID=7936 RepID=A0A0E9VJG1_ANGAN